MLLKEAGIKDIICNLHYKSKDIMAFFDKYNNFDVNITFSIEDKILGTGGGLKKCKNHLCHDDFLIVNSDIIVDINLNELIKHHKATRSTATVVLKKSEAENVEAPVALHNNKVIDFKNFFNTGIESNFIYTGVAVLSPVIFKYLKDDFSSVVYTGFVNIIKHYSLSYFEHKSLWLDIGSINTLWETNMALMKNNGSLNDRLQASLGKSMCIVSPTSTIAKDSRISDSVIGDGCYILEGATIDKSVLLPNSRVDHNTIIKDSIVFRDMIIKI